MVCTSNGWMDVMHPHSKRQKLSLTGLQEPDIRGMVPERFSPVPSTQIFGAEKIGSPHADNHRLAIRSTKHDDTKQRSKR